MILYLMRWNNGRRHEAVFAADGVRRTMRDLFGHHCDVAVYALKDDITAAPQPVRVFYDHIFDRLTVYDLRNRQIDHAGSPVRERVMYETV